MRGRVYLAYRDYILSVILDLKTACLTSSTASTQILEIAEDADNDVTHQ